MRQPLACQSDKHAATNIDLRRYSAINRKFDSYREKYSIL